MTMLLDRYALTDATRPYYVLPSGQVLPITVAPRPSSHRYYLPDGRALPVKIPSSHLTTTRRIDLSRLPAVFGRAVPYDVVARFDQDEFGRDEFYMFAPGAFHGVESINYNVAMHFSHDDSYVLASTQRGTLRFHDEPGDGLYFSSSLKTVADLIERGTVIGASLGWKTAFTNEQILTGSRGRVRIVRRATEALREVSLCVLAEPRFPKTWVGTPRMASALEQLPNGHLRWRPFKENASDVD